MTITELLAIARAATPGPWEVNHVYVHGPSGDCLFFARAYDIGDESAHANARHIAAMHPDRVIALLEFVEAWDAAHSMNVRNTPLHKLQEADRKLGEKRRALEEVTK